MQWKIFGLTALLALLAACGGGGNGGTNNPPPPAGDTLSGTVRLGGGSGSSAALPYSNRLFTSDREEFVPGEVIVKFKPGLSLQSVSILSVGGVSLQRVRPLGLESTSLYRASTDAVGTLRLVQGLKARPDVLWAQPNFIQHPLKTPNDEFYPLQWHYPAINLPQAWDIEDGTSNPVTVAVVDTGVLVQHPDFAGKLLPGYDFITNPRNSNDGDGRDADADDPGDEPGGQSSYHGSHVSGTIAAATNNGSGTAGISWGAKILPVRVLGVGGGTLADIIDGMLWSAGIPVTGTPANPNPAQIINMSLGGKGRCADSPAYQDAIDQINAKGIIIVVAAGNSNEDASDFRPASCSGVITVGATEFQNARARYSNFGPRIDVMAPGGDVQVDLNNDKFADGVLSEHRDDAQGAYDYVFYNGTSMAAPHVAGVIALMKSKKPTLSGAEALDLLRHTARPLDDTACTGPSPDAHPASDCGAGLIDAFAALQALGGGSGGGNPSPDFTLSLSPNSLVIAPGGSAKTTLRVSRTGGFSDALSLSLKGAPNGVTGSLNSSGNSATLTLNVAASVKTATYALTLEATGGGKTKTAALSLTVGTSAAKPTLEGTYVIACLYIGNNCDQVKSKIVQVKGQTSASYSFGGLAAGEYLLIGWKDSDRNEDISSGDYLGIYAEGGQAVLVRPGKSGLDFALQEVQGTGMLSDKVMRALKSLRLR
ncbi:MAG: peptidase S8 [Meiothermus sp.]